MYNLLEAFQAKDINKQNTRALSQPTSFSINSKYYLSRDNIKKNHSSTRSVLGDGMQIPIYEIKIKSGENNGIAIVSGDRRAPHILAYIDKIKDNDTISAAPNTLLQWGEMYIRNEVKAFDEIKDSLYASATSKISKELMIPVSDIKFNDIKDQLTIQIPATRSKVVEEVPSNLKIITAVLPMCPVTWGQWEPYNCMLPEGNCEKFFPGYIEKSNYPAGSGVVAIAHLMAYLEPHLKRSRRNSGGSVTTDRRSYGSTRRTEASNRSSSRPSSSISWTYLTENKEIKAPDYFNAGDPVEKRQMVGNIFDEIYYETYSHTVTNSKGVITGSTCTVSEIESYINYIFDCSSKKKWDINVIKNSLKALEPILVYGKPDNKPSDGVYPFIIDGLKECRGRIDNVPYDVNVNYIHANFGFGSGYQDGYYLMDIEKTTITFETTIPLIFKDNALTMIANIKNKSTSRRSQTTN